MKIAMIQMNTTVGDIAGNRDDVLLELDRARSLGADLVVFPELCLTGYPPRDLLASHRFVEASRRALLDIAERTGSIGAIVGFVDRNLQPEGKELYNAAAFLHEGQVEAVVHKTLLPTYDVFDEERYFERSHETRVIPFQGRRLGISICEDAWNDRDFWPKRLYHTDPVRRQVEQGADLLINVSASPFGKGKPEFRYRMLREQVGKYQVPFLLVNLVGGNDELVFDGNSFALGKDGNVLAWANAFREDVLLVDTEAADHRNPPEREEVEDLFEALVLGTRDYLGKCGFRSAVLGLSGGIDSSLTACIAVEALGAKNVYGVAMPSRYSTTGSHDDARRLAENLGISFQVFPIQPAFEKLLEALAPALDGRKPDITEENIQARIRADILMALSNKFGHLVLNTGNKSELAVGYCTLYGDMAGGLAVLSDVLKTDVYRLARYINREREVIPEGILSKAPSAELRENQTDQDTLPDYDTLDGILHLLIEEQLDTDEAAGRGYARETVEEVFRMITRTEYKRRQAAPGLKVSNHAFGSGRRMPIAAKYRY